MTNKLWLLEINKKKAMLHSHIDFPHGLTYILHSKLSFILSGSHNLLPCCIKAAKPVLVALARWSPDTPQWFLTFTANSASVALWIHLLQTEYEPIPMSSRISYPSVKWILFPCNCYRGKQNNSIKGQVLWLTPSEESPALAIQRELINTEKQLIKQVLP